MYAHALINANTLITRANILRRRGGDATLIRAMYTRAAHFASQVGAAVVAMPDRPGAFTLDVFAKMFADD